MHVHRFSHVDMKLVFNHIVIYNYIYKGILEQHIPGTSEVHSMTSPSPRTSVRGEEPHPFRGATIKYGNLFWVIPV